MFITILISFFLCLLIYLTIHHLFYRVPMCEGMANGASSSSSSDFKDYDPNDPVVLSKQNAGNIQVLKTQMDELLSLKQEVTDMSLNMIKMSGQINDFANAQVDVSNETVGTEEPIITGADGNEDTIEPDSTD